jgi:hypothetical protein
MVKQPVKERLKINAMRTGSLKVLRRKQLKQLLIQLLLGMQSTLSPFLYFHMGVEQMLRLFPE